MPATKANGTLMAHGGLSDDHRLVFCLVELRGLEPLTPCLQNTRRLSDTVAHLGLQPRRVGLDRLVSFPVVVRIGGQLWPCRRDAAVLTLKRQGSGPAPIAREHHAWSPTPSPPHPAGGLDRGYGCLASR
jgi:hypothetical protein